MRRLDIVVVVVFLTVLAISTISAGIGPNERRPDPDRPVVETERGTLEPPTALDPTVEIEMSPKVTDVSGTAFAIAAGVWMSADHVTDSCRRLFVEADGRFMPGFDLVAHPNADVAIFRTKRSGPPLLLTNVLDVGQTGFHHGFPSGEPGDVLSSLIGRARVRVSGAIQRIEPAVVWSESRRFPVQLTQLGGISGGPALDLDGRVVGVTVGSSQRRGTVITAAPVSMREVVAHANANLAPAPGPNFLPSPSKVVAYGNALRRSLTVAKVICLAKRPTRRPLAQP